MKTLAQKYRTTISKIARKYYCRDREWVKKYGKTIEFQVNLKIGEQEFTKISRLHTFKEVKELAKNINRKEEVKRAYTLNEHNTEPALVPKYDSNNSRTPSIKNDDYLDQTSWVAIRTQAALEFPCAICGKMGETEMHYIKAV